MDLYKQGSTQAQSIKIQQLNRSMPIQRVLIIGAGIAGMMFGQCMKEYNIPFEIFEAAESAVERDQSQPLSVHRAIPFMKHIFDQDTFDAFRMSSINPNNVTNQFVLMDGVRGEVLFQDPNFPPTMDLNNQRHDWPVNVYNFDLPNLHRFLERGLDIHWNHSFTGYELINDGITATFKDGTTVQGDLLVGADGVQSLIAEQVDAKNSTILPLSYIGVDLNITRHQYDEIKNTSSTYGVLLGPKNGREGIYSMSFSMLDIDMEKGHYRIYVAISWLNKSGSSSIPAKRADQIQMVKNISSLFHEPFQSLLSNITDHQRTYLEPSYVNIPLPWNNYGRITLIGDAAHSASPYSSEGGNFAIQDAIELCEYLSKVQRNKITISQALDLYQDTMIRRASAAVEISRSGTLMWHSSTANSYKHMIRIIKFIATFFGTVARFLSPWLTWLQERFPWLQDYMPWV
ncbi:hypothetical protein VKS41_003102 [Umbelopsis sp. WA50703]